MEKKQYACPEMQVHMVDPQTMLALSSSDKDADPKMEVLVNERDGKSMDIWGNEF